MRLPDDCLSKERRTGFVADQTRGGHAYVGYTRRGRTSGRHYRHRTDQTNYKGQKSGVRFIHSRSFAKTHCASPEDGGIVSRAA